MHHPVLRITLCCAYYCVVQIPALCFTVCGARGCSVHIAAEAIYELLKGRAPPPCRIPRKDIKTREQKALPCVVQNVLLRDTLCCISSCIAHVVALQLPVLCFALQWALPCVVLCVVVVYLSLLCMILCVLDPLILFPCLNESSFFMSNKGDHFNGESFSAVPTFGTQFFEQKPC